MTNKLKLIALLLTTTLLVITTNLTILLASLFTLFILTLLSAKKAQLLSRIKLLTLPLILIILFNLIFYPNTSLYFKLLSSLTACTKILNLSLLVFLYTSTTSTSQIIKALNFLPKQFTLMLTITLSLIPIIFQEINHISLIQQTKGKHSKNPLPLLIPLIHRILNRTQQLALVIDSRGY